MTAMDATLHIRLDKTIKDDVYRIAREYGVKPSVIIRMALQDFVEKNDKRTQSRINLTTLEV